MSATSSPIVDVFRQYIRLYRLRNDSGGPLDEGLEEEWKQLSFTVASIFSGMYQPGPDEAPSGSLSPKEIRDLLPVDFLRVPTEADVLCETPQRFFSGKLQNISTGGAYVHAAVPFEVESPVRLTFCTFRDRMPLELEGRIAWNNPNGIRKRSLPEGAGVQFTRCDPASLERLQDYVYELVEETLTRANLL